MKLEYLKVLENEKYFSSLREFERYLYPLLLKNEADVWFDLYKDKKLSILARARATYCYSFLTGKLLDFKLNEDVAFYHENRPISDDPFAKHYGLRNGINTMRFEQFKTTGAF